MIWNKASYNLNPGTTLTWSANLTLQQLYPWNVQHITHNFQNCINLTCILNISNWYIGLLMLKVQNMSGHNTLDSTCIRKKILHLKLILFLFSQRRWHIQSSGRVKASIQSFGFLACRPDSATHTSVSSKRWQGKHSSSAKHLSCTAPGSLVTEITKRLYLETPRAQYRECQTTDCENCTNCETHSWL